MKVNENIQRHISEKLIAMGQIEVIISESNPMLTKILPQLEGCDQDVITTTKLALDEMHNLNDEISRGYHAIGNGSTPIVHTAYDRLRRHLADLEIGSLMLPTPVGYNFAKQVTSLSKDLKQYEDEITFH